MPLLQLPGPLSLGVEQLMAVTDPVLRSRGTQDPGAAAAMDELKPGRVGALVSAAAAVAELELGRSDKGTRGISPGSPVHGVMWVAEG